MSQNLIKLTSLLILGLLIGCSGGCSGDSDPSSKVVVVSADDANNGDVTDDTNTVTGDDTGSDTGAATANTGDTEGETPTDTTGAETTSGGSTDANSDSTAGAATTDGTSTTTGTDAGTDGTDTTTGADTDGTTDDTGTTTDGTATATDGVTTGTDTDAGADSSDTAGTDTGTTAAETTGATTDDEGTTAGTDTDGTGTTTAGSIYEEGSLARMLEDNEDVSVAFSILESEGFTTELSGAFLYTVFLPTNDALAADPSLFSSEAYIHTVSVQFEADLAGFNGDTLLMFNAQPRVVTGSGTATQPVTIAGAAIIKADLQGDTGLPVAHIIDAVFADEPTNPNPYPEGSLADVLFELGNMTNVLEALTETDVMDINDPNSEWTFFLPNDSALDDPDDFDLDAYVSIDSNESLVDLTGIVGSDVTMRSGDGFEIGGGTGTEPLTIGGIEIVPPFDVQNEDNEGSIVHIIDGLLEP